MEHRIDIKESLSFGWRTFKARPWFFVGAMLVVTIISIILKIPESSLPQDQQFSALGILYSLLSMVVSILVDLALKSLALSAHDNVAGTSLSSLWRADRVIPFFGVSIILGIIIVVGLILLIVPGIIAALAFGFASLLVLDKGMGPLEALKESARITKGKRLSIAGLFIVLGLLNVLGFLLLFVGILVTVPVSLIALIHAYRSLSASAAPVSVAPVASEPAVPTAL